MLICQLCCFRPWPPCCLCRDVRFLDWHESLRDRGGDLTAELLIETNKQLKDWAET